MGKIYKKEDYQILSDKKHNNTYLIIGEYISRSSKIDIQHLTCGTIFNSTLDNHLNSTYGGCKNCYKIKTKKTIKSLQEESDIKYNYTYEISGNYRNNSSIINFKHLICGTIFSTSSINHLFNKNGGCPCFNSDKKNKKKRSKEELQYASDIKFNSTFEIIGDYINNYTKINIKHLICDTIINVTSNHHLHTINGGCNCYKSSEKLKINFQNKSNNKFNSTFKIIGQYINFYEKIDIKHLICGNILNMTPSNHLYTVGGGCNFCYKKRNIQEIQNKSNNKFNSTFEIISDDENNSDKIIVKHLICGKIFSTYVATHLADKGGCANCTQKRDWTKEEMQLASDQKHHFQFIILNDYIDSQTKISILHKECGKIFEKKLYNHLNSYKCPNCGISEGEKEIEIFLIRNDISYLREKRFENCKNIKPLSFDFYIPKYGICIEFDGKQHFYSIKWYGGERGFEKGKINDAIKTQYCMDNNITLIRIPYYESVENILSKKLKIY